MKRFKSLPLKKKRTLAIAGMSVLTLAVVGTIAYGQDSMFFRNLFRLGDDKMEFIETFDSPEDWQPCQEIPKTAIVTNRNDTPRYVRMKINEYWREKDTETPVSDHETTDLPLTWNDSGTEKHYAVINTQNDDKWTYNEDDGWYYYNTAINKDESTDSLLKSVTFNCEVNTVGDIRYSVDGQSGESVPSEYADATYHLYIVLQASDQVLLSKTRLYDKIASQTQGIDTSTRFHERTMVEYDWLNNYSYWSTYELGVYTLAEKANEEHPVYYFRGKVRDNYVKFSGFCWRIVRTTTTGGSKVIYAGLPRDDGSCYEGDGEYYSMAATSGVYPANYQVSPSITSSIVAGGYMYNDKYVVNGYVDHEYDPSSVPDGNFTYRATYGKYVSESSPVVVSKSISYSDGKYHLTGNTSTLPYGSATERYRYTCFAGEDVTECETAGLIIAANGGNVHYLSLHDGMTAQEAIDDVFTNEWDSGLKSDIDQWYAQNLANDTDKFEDTVWCNDRSINSGPWSLSDTTKYDYSQKGTFAALDRLSNKSRPTTDCSRADDRFTVSSANGNGKLTYPVATISSDEAVLAGHTSDLEYNSISSYLTGYNDSTDLCTMTPSYTEYQYEGGKIFRLQNGQQSFLTGTASGNTWCIVRPMVSFKYDTYISSGNGTATKPYILEWED